MADNRIAGEQVHCHQCQNKWRRDQGGLTCPHCGSEFTEIVSLRSRSYGGPATAIGVYKTIAMWASASQPEANDCYTEPLLTLSSL